MEEAIRRFIEEKVDFGQYFDSHAVLEYLIQNSTNEYLRGAGDHDIVGAYHGRIAQIIDGLVDDNNNKIVSPKGDAISKNIKSNFSKCRLWMKNNPLK